MPITLPEHVYPAHFEPRRVRRDGTVKWAGGHIFVGEAFADECVGIEPTAEERWHVHLGPMVLSVLPERSRTVLPMPEGGG
jgi:hypothetical protein